MAVTASLSLQVLVGGTIGITATFRDDDGKLSTPKELAYTLLDERGRVINSKEKMVVTPDTSVTVPLYGDDLPAGPITFLIEGTYDSQTLGSDLPLKGYAKFNVEPLPGD